MKKFIAIIFIGIAFAYSLKAQVLKNDIFTQNGNPVVTYQMSEISGTERDKLDKKYVGVHANTIPIILYPPYYSTNLFNCHGYTFLKEKGWPDRWLGLKIGNNDPDIYISDGSYYKVPSAVYPGIVFYDRPFDHSAVTTPTTATTNIVISKWIDGPLMQHELGVGPNFGTSWKFYALTPPITGPSVLCYGSSGIYTISLHPAVTVTWDKSTNLSINGSGNSISVTANDNGSGFLIAKADGVNVKTYKVFVGPPSDLTVSGPTYKKAGSTFLFTATTASDLTSISWTITPSKGTTLYPDGKNCLIYFSSLSANLTYTVKSTANNQCGQVTASHSIDIGPYSGEY